MVLPDIGLLQAAIVLAEELHFGRAADRLNMSQPTLSKQIFRLERSVGPRLFEHNHQVAELTLAGQVFIAEAREVVFHAERAILSAQAVVDGSTEILNVGKSSYGSVPAKSTTATDAYVNMDKGVVGFTKVGGHCFGSLFALLIRRYCRSKNGDKPLSLFGCEVYEMHGARLGTGRLGIGTGWRSAKRLETINALSRSDTSVWRKIPSWI